MPTVFSLNAPGRKKPRAWAHGLFWQPALSPAEMRRSLRKIAAEQGFDVYATPRTNGLQAGFGSIREGLKLGSLSFASMLSDFMEAKWNSRSFLLALPLGDGRTWAYVAQQNGVLLPEGDLAGTASDIQSRLLADLTSSDWAHVVAPTEWEIPAAAELTLGEVLTWAEAERSRHKSWAVRRVTADYTKLIVAMAVIFAAGLTGHNLWGKWQEYQVAEQLRIEAASAPTPSGPRVSLPKPWESQPAALAQVQACLAALTASDAFSAGWALKTAGCRAGTLSLVWDRGPTGRIDSLRARYPDARIELTGNSAVLGVPITAPAAGLAAALPDASPAAERLLGLAQGLGLDLTVTRVAPPTDLPGAEPTAPQDWATLKWVVTGTRLQPATLITHLDSPTLRVSAVDFNPVNMTWNLEGELYAKP